MNTARTNILKTVVLSFPMVAIACGDANQPAPQIDDIRDPARVLADQQAYDASWDGPPAIGILLRSGTANAVYYRERFEGDVSDWNQDGLWHQADNTNCASPSYVSATHVMYYGQDASCDYNTGATTSGELVSPSIPAIPANASLSFSYYRQVENYSGSYDRTEVAVSTNGTDWDMVWSQDSRDTSQSAWTQASISLASYAGQDIQVRFHFDSVDHISNTYTGWLIDDVEIVAPRPTPAAPLAYEPFDYATGALHGASGSSEIGLAGTWSNVGFRNASVVGGSLAAPAQTLIDAPTGQKFDAYGNGGYQGAFARPFANSFGDSEGAVTRWVSVLIQSQSASSIGGFNGLRLYGNAGSDIILGWGNGGGDRVWTFDRFGGGSAGDGISSVSMSDSIGQPVLLVGKITFSGNSNPDTLRLFINPGAKEPDDQDAFGVATDIDYGDITQLGIQWNYSAYLDEIRVGTTYAQVASQCAPTDWDNDGDGLCNDAEADFGTDAFKADTDGDELTDHAELFGHRNVDLVALGANPLRRDVFLEADYYPDLKPDQAALDMVEAAFANAPVNNPDGSQGIDLHIDLDDAIDATDVDPDLDPVWDDFDVIKDEYFEDKRADIFHYVLFADQYEGDDSSGKSRGIPGHDLLVTLGAWPVRGGTTQQQAGTLMHELGHNLGLRHGGDDDSNYKPHYLSVMSYNYQTVGLTVNGTAGVVDYSRLEIAAPDESDLDEEAAFSPVANSSTTEDELDDYGVRIRLVSKARVWLTGTAGSNLDMNRNGTVDTTNVSADLNGYSGTGSSWSDSQNDWDNLVFDGADEIGDGSGMSKWLLNATQRKRLYKVAPEHVESCMSPE